MSRVNSGGSVVRNALKLLQKTASEAEKKRAAQQANAKALAKRKDSFKPGKATPKLVKNYTGDKKKDLGSLVGGKGTSKLNRDGSQTTEREAKTKNGSVKQSVTTSKSLGTSKLKFESEATKSNGNITTKHGYEATRDAFGRSSSSQSRETSVKLGNTTTTNGRTTATDFLGNKSVTKSSATAVVDGNTTTTNGTSTTTGAFNTSQTTDEKKVSVKRSETSTSSRTDKTTTGSEFKASSGTELKNGKFTVTNSADWKSGSSREVGAQRDWKLKEPSGDDGFKGPDKLARGQKAGDLVSEMFGDRVKVEVKGQKIDTDNFKELEDFKFVGTKAGITGDSGLSLSPSGAEAKFSRAATAGAYAQSSGKVEGDHGTASYKAEAKVEAKASFDASAKLNANGLDAKVGAKVGVSAEASVNGKLETKPVKFAGVDLTAGVEGNAKVSAELSAEATGTAKITRDPPTALLEGKAGASAVAKAEADVKVSAGPFAVKASGYASAGAEATASGVIGYEDGKLKLGGSLGAALGVGLGGSVNVEVDVKQIGDMAVNTAKAAGKAAHDAADVDGDGKLTLKDVSAAKQAVVKNVSNAASSAAKTVSNAASSAAKTVSNAASSAAKTVSNAASSAAKTVSNAASSAVSTVSNAASSAAKTVSNAASSAASTVSNAASSAKAAVSGAASTVKGWFGW